MRTRGCPICQSSVDRKSFHAIMCSCTHCKRSGCSLCVQERTCIDCYVERNKHEEVALYEIEKRIALDC